MPEICSFIVLKALSDSYWCVCVCLCECQVRIKLLSLQEFSKFLPYSTLVHQVTQCFCFSFNLLCFASVPNIDYLRNETLWSIYISLYTIEKKSSSIPSLILNNPPLKLYIRQKLITFFVLPIKEDDISGLLCTLETFLHKVCKTTLFLLSIKVNFALIISHELTIIRCAITVKFHFR